MQVLKRFEDRAVTLHANSFSNMDSKVRIDSDQVGVERSVVQLRKRYSVLHYGLAHGLVPV